VFTLNIVGCLVTGVTTIPTLTYTVYGPIEEQTLTIWEGDDG